MLSVSELLRSGTTAAAPTTPGVRAMRTAVDPIQWRHRPLLFYALSQGAGRVASAYLMRSRGYARRREGELTYWYLPLPLPLTLTLSLSLSPALTLAPTLTLPLGTAPPRLFPTARGPPSPSCSSMGWASGPRRTYRWSTASRAAVPPHSA